MSYLQQLGKNSSETAKCDRCPGWRKRGRGVSIRPGGMRKGRLSFASRGFPPFRNFVCPTQRHKAGRIEPAERYPASLFSGRRYMHARKPAGASRKSCGLFVLIRGMNHNHTNRQKRTRTALPHSAGPPWLLLAPYLPQPLRGSLWPFSSRFLPDL